MGGFRFCGRFGTAVVAAAVGLATISVAPAAHADPSAGEAAVEPATARVDTIINYQHAIGAGTGFVLDPGGGLLTNFHVVQGADKVTATVGGRPYRADLVGYDRHHDIAVLQLRGAADLPVAPIGDSSQLGVGDEVVALGNADGSGSSLTHEAGHVIGLNRTISAKDELTGSSEQVTGLIQFAAPVRAGDSAALGRRRRPGRRDDDGGDAELPHGSGRRGFRDPDQRSTGNRCADPGRRCLERHPHRAADAARRRCRWHG